MFRGRVGFLVFHGKQSHQCGADEKEAPAIWELICMLPSGTRASSNKNALGSLRQNQMLG